MSNDILEQQRNIEYLLASESKAKAELAEHIESFEKMTAELEVLKKESTAFPSATVNNLAAKIERLGKYIEQEEKNLSYSEERISNEHARLKKMREEQN